MLTTIILLYCAFSYGVFFTTVNEALEDEGGLWVWLAYLASPILFLEIIYDHVKRAFR